MKVTNILQSDIVVGIYIILVFPVRQTPVWHYALHLGGHYEDSLEYFSIRLMYILYVWFGFVLF